MKKSLFKLVLQISRRKLKYHPQKKFRHYSFLIQNNQIVDWAVNLNREPPIHYGYHDRMDDLSYKPKLHSEIQVYLKARGIIDKTQSFDIINIRLNKKGKIRSCKPCTCCSYLMFELGCKNIYFIEEKNNEISFEKLSKF